MPQSYKINRVVLATHSFSHSFKYPFYDLNQYGFHTLKMSST